MFKKIFCLILILKLTQARFGFVPKFYGQDSAVIVDTDKSLTKTKNSAFNYSYKIRMPPPFSLWRHYPRYHIVPPPPPGQILAINTWPNTAYTKTLQIPITKFSTTTTTTTTTTPRPTTPSSTTYISKSTISSSLLTEDEFPDELLDIAQQKLGINSIDEIPSLSELGQLLGTNSQEETLSYIKQLTSNDQGIALMKAYIESTDYTDTTGDVSKKNYDLVDDEEEDVINDGIEDPPKVSDEGLIVITDNDSNDDYEIDNVDNASNTNSNQREIPKIVQKLEDLPQAVPSANYMHLNNQFNKNEEDNENTEYHKLNRFTENGIKISAKQENRTKDQTESEITRDLKTNETNTKTNILARTDTIPFNYPVPIRVQKTTTTSLSPSASVVHLNSPKIVIPYVQQLSRVTKIPSKILEDFLASKPKLLELANKVSRFPINYDRDSPIETQVMAAIHKAFEQDEDLQTLLSSTDTLK